jgi:thiol-disulfide isomerase/thioredoxin
MDDKLMTNDDVALAGKRRRQLLVLGVAAAAALAGAGLAWRRFSPHESPSGGGGSAAEGALWEMRFESPTGDPVPMAAFRGRPLLLNFWATWCPPCIEELPLLNRFYQQNSGKSWQVLGIAVDQPSAVRKFLAKSPLGFPVAMAGFEGTDISRSLGNLAGALPYSVVFDARSQVVYRKMGVLTERDLASLITAYTP